MKKKSFNLVEIATVVSIILIITSSVAASFFIAGSKRLEAEARKIIYDAAWIREAAVSSHQNYRLHFTSNYYEIYDGGGNLIKRENLVSQITSPSTPFDVYFYPFSIGTSSWTAGDADDISISLAHQGKTKTITVFGKTGFVKIP